MNNIIWGAPDKLSRTFLAADIDADELYRERNEIWFSTNVTSKTINKLIKLIHDAIHDDKLSAYRDAEEFFEIVLHIDSYGGCANAIFKFIDCVEQLKKRKIRFRTIINGKACSAATLMAIVGNKKQITKHSCAMIHELQTVAGGYHTHIRSYFKYLEKLHNNIVNVYNSFRSPRDDHSEITREQIERWMAEETWFDAKTYLEMGFVDEII